MSTTIVTVCYNSMAVLPGMLASVPPGVSVVLVDNGSDDIDALQKIADQYQARLIRNTQNKGFGTACNQGAEIAQTKYLLFLNPDTQLSRGAIDAFEKAAHDHPNASAFNPRLLGITGKLTLRRRSKLDPTFTLSKDDPKEDIDLPVLSGSAIFTRRELFDQVGGFDTNIFLYHEDDDLSARLRKRGPLMLADNAIVTHNAGHGSARTPEIAQFKAYHMARSKVYTWAKHGRSNAWLRTLWQAVLSFLSPAMLSRRKRAKAIGFLKGTLSAKQDGGCGSGT